MRAIAGYLRPVANPPNGCAPSGRAWAIAQAESRCSRTPVPYDVREAVATLTAANSASSPNTVDLATVNASTATRSGSSPTTACCSFTTRAHGAHFIERDKRKIPPQTPAEHRRLSWSAATTRLATPLMLRYHRGGLRAGAR